MALYLLRLRDWLFTIEFRIKKLLVLLASKLFGILNSFVECRLCKALMETWVEGISQSKPSNNEHSILGWGYEVLTSQWLFKSSLRLCSSKVPTTLQEQRMSTEDMVMKQLVYWKFESRNELATMVLFSS